MPEQPKLIGRKCITIKPHANYVLQTISDNLDEPIFWLGLPNQTSLFTTWIIRPYIAIGYTLEQYKQLETAYNKRTRGLPFVVDLKSYPMVAIRDDFVFLRDIQFGMLQTVISTFEIPQDLIAFAIMVLKDLFEYVRTELSCLVIYDKQAKTISVEFPAIFVKRDLLAVAWVYRGIDKDKVVIMDIHYHPTKVDIYSSIAHPSSTDDQYIAASRYIGVVFNVGDKTTPYEHVANSLYAHFYHNILETVQPFQCDNTLLNKEQIKQEIVRLIRDKTKAVQMFNPNYKDYGEFLDDLLKHIYDASREGQNVEREVYKWKLFEPRQISKKLPRLLKF